MYTSVQRVKLQQAFAIAHQMGEHPTVPKKCRDRFRDIAKLIWEAHGEPGQIPQHAGAVLAAKMGGPVL